MNSRWAALLAWRSLRHHALRSWICAWTISAAVCALLVTRGLTVGAAERAEQVLDRLANSYLVVFDSLATTLPSPELDALADPLRQAGVQSRFDVLCAVFLNDADPIPFQICGLSAPQPKELGEMLKLTAGAWPQTGAAELVLEHHLAARWKLKPGDRLQVFPRQPPMTVSGLFARQAQFATPDAFTSLSSLQTLRRKPEQITLAFLALAPHRNSAAAEAEVQALLPDARVLRPEVLRDRLAAAAAPLALAGALHALFIGSLCGLICLFAQWSAVHERRADLAVLRVLGYPRRVLMGSVLFEAALIGGIGAVKGAVLGVFVLSGLIPSLHPGLGGRVPGSEIALAMALGLLLAIVGAALPALRASRSQPQELLA